MAASCNSRKGCGWLPFVQGERGGMEAFAVVFASIVLLACVASGLLLAVLIPRPFSFLLSHPHIPIFIKGFRAFLGSLPPPSPAMLLPLACRKGFFRVVPLPLRDACGAQGMYAEADPDMMRAGGDPSRFHRIGRGSVLRAASLRGPKGLFAFLAGNGICRVFQSKVMAARRRAMRRIRPFKEGKA